MNRSCVRRPTRCLAEQTVSSGSSLTLERTRSSANVWIKPCPLCSTSRSQSFSERRRRHSVLAQLAPRQVGEAVLINSAVFTVGFKVLSSGLSNAAIAHSWFLGTVCLTAFQLRGYALVCLYFVVGTLVTKIGKKTKVQEGTYERNEGKRTPASVWGSGLAAAICAVLALAFATGEKGQHLGVLLRTGFVASFASKLSDTVASEIGKAFGKTTFLITTFKRVKRGTDGAVSLEGTLAGLFASIAYAGLALSLGLIPPAGAVAVTLASFLANNIESVLGATVQQQYSTVLTNDVVNMAQISIAALLAVLFHASL